MILKALKPFIVAFVYSLIGAAIFISLEAENDRIRKVDKAKNRIFARRELMYELVQL